LGPGAYVGAVFEFLSLERVRFFRTLGVVRFPCSCDLVRINLADVELKNSVVFMIARLAGFDGVLSTTVSMRTAEIGMRMALGASTQNIFALIARQGAILAAFGIVAGVVSAFWLSRVMTTMLVGVTATDPVTFVVMGVLFLAIALVACSIPALRAARLAPVAALRED
jgi:ABC-type lipoprotein release transport system permease subunit